MKKIIFWVLWVISTTLFGKKVFGLIYYCQCIIEITTGMYPDVINFLQYHGIIYHLVELIPTIETNKVRLVPLFLFSGHYTPYLFIFVSFVMNVYSFDFIALRFDFIMLVLSLCLDTLMKKLKDN